MNARGDSRVHCETSRGARATDLILVNLGASACLASARYLPERTWPLYGSISLVSAFADLETLEVDCPRNGSTTLQIGMEMIATVVDRQ
jgi:hypothetical protein